MLTSRTLESAIPGGTWSEGQKKSDGLYYIIVDDWDEAFLCLPNMSVLLEHYGAEERCVSSH
jgi:hypothetical protein